VLVCISESAINKIFWFW